jgi:hypothetical protein
MEGEMKIQEKYWHLANLTYFNTFPTIPSESNSRYFCAYPLSKEVVWRLDALGVAVDPISKKRWGLFVGGPSAIEIWRAWK